MKILVVDDDATVRSLMTDVLAERNHEVLEAENGQHALTVLQSNAVDLIFTDRTMPIMDGLEFLRTLHERGITIPTVVISAYGEEELWAQAVSYGAKEYLLKPFKPRDILSVVEKFEQPRRGPS